MNKKKTIPLHKDFIPPSLIIFFKEPSMLCLDPVPCTYVVSFRVLRKISIINIQQKIKSLVKKF